ncbi:MAG: hypothetical protein VX951_11815 [Planctomycetota bacterium]|nr:hypothetical protein [Planctomycetota bacterium]
MRTIPTILTLACSLCTVPAQEIIHESLTGAPWGHTATGTWNNGITESRSLFGKVDHLVAATTFTYSRSPLILEAGTYIAVARFAKVVSTTGSAPIDLSMIIPSSKTLTTDVSSQTLDSFIHTRTLNFNLSTKSSVLFSLSNLSTTNNKADYYFDSFYVGKVQEGPVELIESLGRRWGHTHAAPYYLREVADASATFGFCDALGPSQGNGLWWFDWSSGVKQFSTGLYTFNLRIKKVVDLAGWADFDLWVSESTDNGATWQAGSKIEWKRADHIVNKWVESPNYTFFVSNPNNLYRFFWNKTGGAGNGAKYNYHFDSFAVRKGEFTPYGTSCVRSGKATLKGTIPQLGSPFEIKCGPISNPQPMTMILGLADMNLDLGPMGWPGCYLLARMDILIPLPIVRGAARLNMTLPNDPTLIGIPFYTQAYKPSPTGALKSSNGVRGVIGN